MKEEHGTRISWYLKGVFVKSQWYYWCRTESRGAKAKYRYFAKVLGSGYEIVVVLTWLNVPPGVASLPEDIQTNFQRMRGAKGQDTRASALVYPYVSYTQQSNGFPIVSCKEKITIKSRRREKTLP